MIQSMTGFGRASSQIEGKSLTVEVRSVNSRYLEIHIRVPREYAELEMAARKKIKESLLRGRVDVSVALTSSEEDSVAVNEVLLEKYLALCLRLGERYGLKQEPDLVQLLRFPRVSDSGEPALPAAEAMQGAFESVLDQAVAGLKEFRAREGQSLEAELMQRLKNLGEHLDEIRRRSDGLPALCRTRLAERMKQLLPEGLAAEDRILVEAAVFADKSDIREELARLDSHLCQFRELIRAGGDAGRRLDFLLQEMNRETNTILSKADLMDVSRIGVEMKAEIERLREQVQNIE